MDKKEKSGTPSELAWAAFKNTGKVSYYRLYKKLTEED